jgi:hypothetical protein
MKFLQTAKLRLKTISKKWSIALAIALALGSMGATAETLVESFNSTGSLQPGWIVTLSKNSGTVGASPASDSSKMYGVVIDPSDAPLTLNRQDAQVFVATSGSYPVLVSNERGSIKNGDYVSISSIDGIGAKASGSQPVVLGRASSGFDGKTNIITKVGSYAIGRVIVNIAPSKNPISKTDTAVPSILQKVTSSVAGKDVPAVRIYLALAVLLVANIITVTILYVGIRSGMIALGRNPLSKHTIMESMFKVIIVASSIFIIGLAGVYLLLKL